MLKELKDTVKEFNVGTNQLRAFGSVIIIILVSVYLFLNQSALLVLFAVASVILTILAPRQWQPIVKVLIAITFPIGWLLSRLLLIIFYFLILTPIGIIFRFLRGREWRISKQTSYWVDVEQNNHHDRMSL